MLDTAPQYWGNPFPGLRPFEEEDAHLFFGRETQVRELLARMDDERFIAVVGLSGSGKSSLVRAGLIPALRRGKLSGAGVRWRVAVMRPGGDPFAALAAALNDPGVLGSSATREATLRASSFGLLHAGKEGRKPGQNLLVVVDQFEEIFRLRDDIGQRWNQAVDFVAELLATARDFRPEFATYVVLTMRSDYLGDCAQFSGLPEALNRGQYLVPRLAEDDWYRALRKPAEQAGTPLDEQLLQQLMADAGDTTDQLPVLQHLLMRMWDMRDDTRITLDAYKKAGGWAGALNQHLDDILSPLDDAQRDLARRVWQRLTEVGDRSRDSRSPARVAELMAITGRTLPEVAAVVEPFRAEGCNFLVSADYPLREDSIIDISHESLIRRWNALVGWAKQEGEWRDAYKAAEAEALSTVPEPWKGAKLEGALEQRRVGQWTEAWAHRYARGDSDEERRASYDKAIRFLSDSQSAEHRRRQHEKWVFRGVAAACVLFLTLAALSAYFWRAAVAAERQALKDRADAITAQDQAEEDRAKAVAAQDQAVKAREDAVTAQDQAEEDRAKAIDAQDQAVKERTEARIAASRAMLQDAARSVEADRPDQALAHFSRALRLDPTSLAARSWISDLLRRTWWVPGMPMEHPGAVTSAAFSADGDLVVTTAESSVLVWSTATGRQRGQVILKGDPAAFKGFSHVEAPRIRFAAFSSDGRRAAAVVTYMSLSRPQVQLWDLRTGVQIGKPLSHVGTQESIAISRDGRRVLTQTAVGTAQVWDTSNAMPVGEHLRFEDSVAASTFSPDGRRLLTVHDRGVPVRLWNAETGALIGAPPLDPDNGLLFAVFSPDGRRVMMSTVKGWQVYDVESAKPSSKLWPSDPATSATFSPDGSRFVSTALKQAQVRDAQTGELVGTPLDHARDVESAVFSPDGRWILTVSSDDARVWDAATGAIIGQTLHHSSVISTAAFSPDGRRVVTASGDGTARIWEIASGEQAGYRARAWDVATSLSTDGRRLATIAADSTIQLWQTDTLLPAAAWRAPEPLRDLALSPNGKLALTIGDTGTVRLWDADTGKPIAAIPKINVVPTSSLYSADGRRIAMRLNTGAIQVFETSSGRLAGKPIPFTDSYTRENIRLSPDGRFAFASGLGVWDVDANKPIDRGLSDKAMYYGVFSPDGRRVAVRTANQTAGTRDLVQVRDLADGAAVGQPLRHDKMVDYAVFTPDSTRIVTVADTTAQAWDITTGRPVGEPLRHVESITVVAVSADGRRVLTADGDRAHVWEMGSGKPIGTPLGRGGEIVEAAFTPDGRRVVIAARGERAGVGRSNSVWQVLLGSESAEDAGRLADLAEAVSGYRVNEFGSLVLPFGDDGARLQRLREWAAPRAKAGGTDLAAFIQAFFSGAK